MRSLRRQLTFSLLLGLGLLMLAGGAGFYVLVRSRLQSEFDEALRSRALALASLLEVETEGEVEFMFADELMPEFDRPTEPHYFQVWYPSHAVLERSRSLKGGDLSLPVEPWAPLHTWDVTLPDGRRGRAAALEFPPHLEDDAGEVSEAERSRLGLGAARLIYARDRAELDHTLAMFLGASAVLALALLIGSGLLVLWLVKRGLQPLERVAAEAALITPENLSQRFNIHALPEELHAVCARLNDALTRLDAAFTRERRFTSDVAHELRTPLAELRTSADVALRWKDDPKLAEHGVETARDIAVQMERLVATLLAMTRCQSGKQTLQPEALILGALAEEAWQPFAQRAQAKRLRVEFDLSRDAVTGDRTLLMGILTNLAGNAAEYTPPGGEVLWRAVADDGEVALDVVNTNTDLQPRDIAHVADPFWRKDESRSSAEHSGLGLSLCESFAALMGGRLQFALDGNSVFTARLTLPRGATPPSSTVNSARIDNPVAVEA